jgi:hypothetical protein
MEMVLPAFSKSLSESGCIIGRNLAIERRSLQGDNAELPPLAADLSPASRGDRRRWRW